MKLVVQRVTEASVEVSGSRISSIGKGLLILTGIEEEDSEAHVQKMSLKTVNLRIFSDDQDKTNLSVRDVGGEILAVSQFTLAADISKGNRPSFTSAKEPKEAERLFELFCSTLEDCGLKVKKGVFGASMQVSLINDGPFTLII